MSGVSAAMLDALKGRLIVSCQAPPGSPLHDAYVIARMALAAERGGAAALRIDSPAHIRAVRALCRVPIVGLHKQQHEGADVYITPTPAAADAVVEAGADIVAVDATPRERPHGATLDAIVERLRGRCLVMADISTADEGFAALDVGVDVLATTLSGYTAQSEPRDGPDLTLVSDLARRTHVPVICEGRIRSADDVRRAFAAGAFAVVVGGAITGVDQLVRHFVEAAAASSAAHADEARTGSDA